MRIDRDGALAALRKWTGWREGPDNENPFGPWQGIANAAYCESFADGQLNRETGYDHTIGLTVSHTQFGAKGDAYTPWGVDHAKERGEWMQDEASQGRPCDLLPGDQTFFAWNNGVGPDPDHVETVVAVYDDLTFDTIGANTGNPNGVWCPVRRDRIYLLGRRRPQLYDVAPPPAPPALQEDDMYIFDAPAEVGGGIYVTDGDRAWGVPNRAYLDAFFFTGAMKHLGTLTADAFFALRDRDGKDRNPGIVTPAPVAGPVASLAAPTI